MSLDTCTWYPRGKSPDHWPESSRIRLKVWVFPISTWNHSPPAWPAPVLHRVPMLPSSARPGEVPVALEDAVGVQADRSSGSSENTWSSAIDHHSCALPFWVMRTYCAYCGAMAIACFQPKPWPLFTVVQFVPSADTWIWY